MVRLKKGLWQITDVSIGVLVVIVMAASVIGPLAYSLQDSVRMNITASQARRVEAAANKYITDNYSAIGAASSPSQGYTLTVPMLVTAGYLPAGFSARNHYSSTYKTLIYRSCIQYVDGYLKVIISLNKCSYDLIMHLGRF